jgi:hypothetical protein
MDAQSAARSCGHRWKAEKAGRLHHLYALGPSGTVRQNVTLETAMMFKMNTMQ